MRRLRILFFSFLILANVPFIFLSLKLHNKSGFNSTSNSSLNFASVDMIETHIMVPMRDGINLSTFVYLPNDIGEDEMLPAILLRSIYPKFWDWINAFEEYSRSFRWAFIFQNIRGSCSTHMILLL